MSNSSAPIASINVTPLVDVLLVLLIIFMITAPVATHRLLLNLPQRVVDAPQPPPDPLRLRIDADGGLFLEGAAIRPDVLAAEAAFQSVQDAKRGIEIDAADAVAYAHVADVLGTLKNAGLTRVSFAAHGQ